MPRYRSFLIIVTEKTYVNSVLKLAATFDIMRKFPQQSSYALC